MTEQQRNDLMGLSQNAVGFAGNMIGLRDQNELSAFETDAQKIHQEYQAALLRSPGDEKVFKDYSQRIEKRFKECNLSASAYRNGYQQIQQGVYKQREVFQQQAFAVEQERELDRAGKQLQAEFDNLARNVDSEENFAISARQLYGKYRNRYVATGYMQDWQFLNYFSQQASIGATALGAKMMSQVDPEMLQAQTPEELDALIQQKASRIISKIEMIDTNDEIAAYNERVRKSPEMIAAQKANDEIARQKAAEQMPAGIKMAQEAQRKPAPTEAPDVRIPFTELKPPTIDNPNAVIEARNGQMAALAGAPEPDVNKGEKKTMDYFRALAKKQGIEMEESTIRQLVRWADHKGGSETEYTRLKDAVGLKESWDFQHDSRVIKAGDLAESRQKDELAQKQSAYDEEVKRREGVTAAAKEGALKAAQATAARGDAAWAAAVTEAQKPLAPTPNRAVAIPVRGAVQDPNALPGMGPTEDTRSRVRLAPVQQQTFSRIGEALKKEVEGAKVRRYRGGFNHALFNGDYSMCVQLVDSDMYLNWCGDEKQQSDMLLLLRTMDEKGKGSADAAQKAIDFEFESKVNELFANYAKPEAIRSLAVEYNFKASPGLVRKELEATSGDKVGEPEYLDEAREKINKLLGEEKLTQKEHNQLAGWIRTYTANNRSTTDLMTALESQIEIVRGNKLKKIADSALKGTSWTGGLLADSYEKAGREIEKGRANVALTRNGIDFIGDNAELVKSVRDTTISNFMAGNNITPDEFEKRYEAHVVVTDDANPEGRKSRATGHTSRGYLNEKSKSYDPIYKPGMTLIVDKKTGEVGRVEYPDGNVGNWEWKVRVEKLKGTGSEWVTKKEYQKRQKKTGAH